MSRISLIKSLITLAGIVTLPFVTDAFSAPGTFMSDSTDQQSESLDAEYSVISVQHSPEWEPGLVRIIRQISIDGKGSAQVVVLHDDVVTSLATFNYSPEAFAYWRQQVVSNLADRYLSTEMEDKGILVEGVPDSRKFYFLYPQLIKIIDTDTSYAQTPEQLSTLAGELAVLAEDAQPAHLATMYFVARPLGLKQSQSILYRFDSLPTLEEVRLMIGQQYAVALDRPTWLVSMPYAVREKLNTELKKLYEASNGGDFFYVKTPQGQVLEMRFLDTK